MKTSSPERAREWEPNLDDKLVQEYIRERVGEDGIPVAKFIEKKQPVQGVEIIETFSDKPAAIRKVLYKLEDARVAEYQKDTDKTGWETFFWRLTLQEVKHQINKERKKVLHGLQTTLQVEQENSFYTCPDGHERVIFEDALKKEFKCPDCQQPMSHIENRGRIKELEMAVRELEQLVFD